MMQGICSVPVQTPLLPEPITTTYYKVPGTCSDPSGANLYPPVVFLHGFDSNILEFRTILEPLRQAPFASFCVDILGWGFTGKPASIGYSPAEKRAHLHAWKTSVLGDRPVVFAGASIGGAVAIDYALEFPEHVAQLVLVNAQAYQDKEESPLLKLPVAGDLLANAGAAVLKSSWLRRMAVKMSYSSEAFKTSEDILNIGGLHTFTDGYDAASVDFIRGQGYCVSKRVAELGDKPVLVIYGECDQVLPSSENAERFAADLLDCSVHAIPNAGHSAHVEVPGEVARLVQEFVCRCPQELPVP